MSPNNINTSAIQAFINQVKAADSSKQKEIKMDINTAKTLQYTLALVMTRLAGNYEGLLVPSAKEETTIDISMDGGNWDH
jgi:hypothetical protein